MGDGRGDHAGVGLVDHVVVPGHHQHGHPQAPQGQVVDVGLGDHQVQQFELPLQLRLHVAGRLEGRPAQAQLHPQAAFQPLRLQIGPAQHQLFNVLGVFQGEDQCHVPPVGKAQQVALFNALFVQKVF